MILELVAVGVFIVYILGIGYALFLGEKAKSQITFAKTLLEKAETIQEETKQREIRIAKFLQSSKRLLRRTQRQSDKIAELTSWINPKICLPESGSYDNRNIVEIRVIREDMCDIEERYLAYYDSELELWDDLSGVYRFQPGIVVGWRKLIP